MTDKLYYRIGEVARLVGVKPHVLRFWETEFPIHIRPQKSKHGQRIYSRVDVDRLIRIRELLHGYGFTIASVKKRMRAMRSEHPHLIEGEFQSDKYPTTPRGKVPLSCGDPAAQDLLWEYAQRHRKIDPQFSDDLEIALKNKGYVPKEENAEKALAEVDEWLHRFRFRRGPIECVVFEDDKTAHAVRMELLRDYLASELKRLDEYDSKVAV